MGVEWRSLFFDFEGIGDRVLWVMSGDRCLMWEIGDRFLWVLSGDLSK
jgi:hypothetical protein